MRHSIMARCLVIFILLFTFELIESGIQLTKIPKCEFDNDLRPYQAEIMRNPGWIYPYEHKCGGSIISDKFVLTAAHCVFKLDVGSIAVRVGTAKKLSGGSVIQVGKKWVHENYVHRDDGLGNGNGHDVALLLLSEPIRLDCKSKWPVQLAEEGFRAKPGTRAVVAGWGRQHCNDTDSSGTLKVVTYILHPNRCLSLYMTPKLYCVKKSTFKGDSGGALVSISPLFPGIQIGIVSYGINSTIYGDGFTDVGMFRSWIRNISGV